MYSSIAHKNTHKFNFCIFCKINTLEKTKQQHQFVPFNLFVIHLYLNTKKMAITIWDVCPFNWCNKHNASNIWRSTFMSYISLSLSLLLCWVLTSLLLQNMCLLLSSIPSNVSNIFQYTVYYTYTWSPIKPPHHRFSILRTKCVLLHFFLFCFIFSFIFCFASILAKKKLIVY